VESGFLTEGEFSLVGHLPDLQLIAAMKRSLRFFVAMDTFEAEDQLYSNQEDEFGGIRLVI